VAGEVIGVRDTRRTRWVLVVLLVVALGLIALDYSDGTSAIFRGMRSVAGSVFGGAEHAASSVGRFFSGSGSAGSQVTQLQKEVLKLRTQLNEEQLSQAQYAQLHKLLLVAAAGQYRVVAADVIGIGQGFQQTVTLDTGSADGVRVNDTVVNGQGLVGQVTAVTGSTCTVLLASDTTSVIGVAVAPSGQLGWINGPGKTADTGALWRAQMLSSTAALKVGSQFVTSSSAKNRSFVPGVPVGVVSKILNRAGSLTAIAMVRPYVNFSALGIVGVVIVPPKHNPRFSVLPPLPRPVPTVTKTVTVTARPGAHPSGSPSPGG